MRRVYAIKFIAAFAVGLLVPAAANALPDAEGCRDIIESDFGLYTVEKCYEVWAEDNPDNPYPVAGNTTYVYTLENQLSSLTSILRFESQTPLSAGAITEATFLGGSGGVEPTAISTATIGQITYTFATLIAPGAKSAPLVVVSPFGPGSVLDTLVTAVDEFGFDEAGNCVGPVFAPPPVACTIGFWKNRQDEKKGLLKFFPDGNFDLVKAEAVAISTVFSSEAELIDALTSKGPRSILERGRQQLAALLLNVAAGNLYPANTKCRLFLGSGGTVIDTDGDGAPDLTMEEAITLIESNLLSGDEQLEHDAHNLADDINNGIGVIEQTMFN